MVYSKFVPCDIKTKPNDFVCGDTSENVVGAEVLAKRDDDIFVNSVEKVGERHNEIISRLNCTQAISSATWGWLLYLQEILFKDSFEV